MKTSVDTLIKRFGTIKSERAQWENLWQECADFCLPQKAIITTTRTPGTKLKTDNYDSTAIQAAQIFAAGLNSYLTNPATQWFALRTRERELMEIAEVKDWLKVSETAIYDHLNSSNFNQVIHEDYIDFSIFGTSTLYEEEDSEDMIRFFVRNPREIYILANYRGRIDTIYRNFVYTARQAYQKWGGNAGQKVLDLMEAGKVEEKVDFLHITMPREERDIRKKDRTNMPVASLYIEPKTKKVLGEGGYEEFPFFIGRSYKVSDSEYAYSPASMAIADIKMLNQMSKDIMEAAQKTLFPPVILPHDGYLLPFKTTPKAINYKVSGDPDDKVESLQMNREIGLSLEMENQRRSTIQKAFFVDLFLILGNLPDVKQQRTATEIAERVNERMLILGPILGRIMHEKLDPMIIRTYNILRRNFRIPPLPEVMRGREYGIEYVSPLARAQKASEIHAYDDLLGVVNEIKEMAPMAVDNLDVDKIIHRRANINNVGDVLRPDDEIKEIREQRAQEAQAREIVENLPAGAEGLKTMVETEGMLKGGASGAGAKK